MNAPVKTYSVTIETDSGKDRYLSCIDPVMLAKDALELAAHVKDAIAFSTDDEEVTEAASRDLLEWGVDITDGVASPRDFGTSYNPRFHDSLHEMVLASRALEDRAEEIKGAY